MSNSKNLKYRFPLWIAVFFLLLILVPFGIHMNIILLAKVAGILSTVFLIIAIRFWLTVDKNRNNKIDRIILNANDMFDLLKSFPVLKSWSKSDMQVLKDRIGILLANYSIAVVDNDEAKLMSKKDATRFAAFLIFMSMDRLVGIKKLIRFTVIYEKESSISDSVCYLSKDTINFCLESYVSQLKSFSDTDNLLIENLDLLAIKKSLA
jgi:hypothetical protein